MLGARREVRRSSIMAGKNRKSQRVDYPAPFVQAVLREAATRNWQILDWQGDGFEYREEGKDGKQFIGLENLYRRCLRVEQEEWPRLIAEFFDQVSSAIYE